MKISSQYSGIYGGHFNIKYSQYCGLDYSKICFIFPGQNSSVPGMLRTTPIKDLSLLNKVSELCLKYGLPQIEHFLLTPEKLTSAELQEIAVLSLFTYQVLVFKHLQQIGIDPTILTSHSIGEAAALVCAEIYQFDDIFDFLVHRHKYSPPSFSCGSMIAVLMAPNEINALRIPSPYSVANINSPFQTVISCAAKDTEPICNFLRRKSISHIYLKNVPQPYHCHLLNPAQELIKQHVKKQNYSTQKPRYPLFSSVLSQLVDFKPTSHELLTHQLTTAVNFQKQISTISEKNYAVSFIELSNKKVATKFVGEILDPTVHATIPLTSLLKKQNKKAKSIVIKKEDLKLFQLISSVIAKFTGYSLESIKIEDRFQEDLNIDSIKKAEIIYEILKESNNSPNQIFRTTDVESVADTLDLLKSPTLHFDHTPTFYRYQYKWSSIPSPKWTPIIFDKTIDLAAPLRGDDLPEKILIKAINHQDSYQETLLPFILWWKTVNSSKVKHITLHSQDENNATSFALQAFFLALSQEKAITFNHIISNSNIEITTTSHHQILKIEDSIFSIPTFEKSPLPDSAAPQIKSILAIGGAKGITFELLNSLPENPTCSLYIVGRSPPPQIEKYIHKLKKSYGTVKYLQADICNARQTDQLFEKLPPIDLLIFAAGIENSAFLEQKTSQEIKAELDTKILGTQHITKHSHKFKDAIFFSSITGLWGNRGQTIYSCANAFMSKISAGKNIHWPAWDSVGMTAKKGISFALKAAGFSLLPIKEANTFFLEEIKQQQQDNITYLSSTNATAYNLMANAITSHQAFLGTMKAPLSPTLTKTFSLTQKENSFLKGHRINGKIVLPAAYAITQFLLLGKIIKKSPIALDDFAALNPFLVEEQSSLALTFNQNKLLLYSSMLHFKADLNTTSQFPTTYIQKKPIASIKTVIKESEIYSRYLFHTPPFNLLEKISIGSDGSALAQGKIEAHQQGLLFLIDAALQTAALTLSLRNAALHIPTGIQQIIYSDEKNFHGPFEIWLNPSNPQTGSCQLVASYSGQPPVLQFTNVSLSPLKKQALAI